jgi:hypothetical protein
LETSASPSAGGAGIWRSEDAGKESLPALERAGAHTNIAHTRRSLAITLLKRGRAKMAAAQARELAD